MDDVDAAFDKCTQTVLRKDGTILIACKLGNWSVAGIDREFARSEARRYFAQYYRDGEYDEMLASGPLRPRKKGGEA